MNKEIINITGLQVRADDGNSRMITGRAIVFNSDSQNMGFIERIMPEAITRDVIAQSDIFALFNHNQDAVLARSNHGEGTLALDVDSEGVTFMFDAPNTSLGNDVIELVKRGDLNGCSFAFTIPNEEGSEKWYRDADNVLRRDINKIDRLYDISIVTTPAYPSTSVAARNKLDEIEALNTKLDGQISELETLMKDE